MNLDLLTAISPIDGRYRGKTEQLANYFSEYALIRYRVRVEIEYFITLCELPLPQLASFDKSLFERLRDIYRNFDENEAQRVKDIEKVTNHDVKAVEYFIKEEFDKIGGLDDYKEFIHFGLTSQDINNTSVPLSVKEALEECFYPQVEELIAQLQTYADEWKDVPMLAKTHGQPASPTRLGKEIMVYVYRLTEQLESLKACKFTAKFGIRSMTGRLSATSSSARSSACSVNSIPLRSATTIISVLSLMPSVASIPSSSTWTVISGCISLWITSSRRSRQERLAQVLCHIR